MDGTKALKRYLQTRRFTGRRGITPMKSKHRKLVSKTRNHKVEKRPNVRIRKHTIPQQSCEWQTTDTQECCENQEWQGNQDCHSDERWKTEEKHTQTQQSRNTENSEKSVHPGPVQTVPEMYKRCADDTETTETEIEAEELL
jgi:hypothetical protein